MSVINLNSRPIDLVNFVYRSTSSLGSYFVVWWGWRYLTRLFLHGHFLYLFVVGRSPILSVLVYPCVIGFFPPPSSPLPTFPHPFCRLSSQLCSSPPPLLLLILPCRLDSNVVTLTNESTEVLWVDALDSHTHEPKCFSPDTIRVR